LKVAVFVNIFQAIGVHLCPLLLLFLFSSRTSDVSQGLEAWEVRHSSGAERGSQQEAGSQVAMAWGGQCRAPSPKRNGSHESQWGGDRWQRNQPGSLGCT